MTTTRNDDAIAANGLLARATLSTILIVAAVTALAVTSLLRTHEPATAQTPAAVAQAAAAPIPMSVPLDSGDVGPFAFGHLVFDWDPAAPGGVPGFDSWPPIGKR